MTRAVLIAVTDRNYLEPAKQLFSSAHFRGGWSGDLLLLHHGLTEQEQAWFHDRGILADEATPTVDHALGRHSAALTLKLAIFGTSILERWDHVLYLDADMTVRAPLDDLVGRPGLHAVQDAIWRLGTQFKRPEDVAPEFRDRFDVLEGRDLRGRACNTGLLSFRSQDVPAGFDRTWADMLDHITPIQKTWDQAALNVLWPDWQELPRPYNVLTDGPRNTHGIPSERLEGIVIHFAGPFKPWETKRDFHDEWQQWHARADEIDRTDIPVVEPWSPERVAQVDAHLRQTEQEARKLRKARGLRRRVGRAVKARLPGGAVRRLRPLWGAVLDRADRAATRWRARNR